VFFNLLNQLHIQLLITHYNYTVLLSKLSTTHLLKILSKLPTRNHSKSCTNQATEITSRPAGLVA
jgi:hypothetical protein